MTEPVMARIAIGSTKPYETFGGVDFIRIEGRLHGELAVGAGIPGLDRAPQNSRGLVEYSAPFILVMPRGKSASNGALLIDVPNRGRPIAHHLYNSARDPFLPVGAFDPGNGFLQAQGYSVAMLQWELGHGIALPSFKDDKGTVHQVEGVGIAALRDFAHFLRLAETDGAGTPNPLHGRIDRTLAVGYSQTARVLKRMLVDGLDIVGGRRVFDALHVHAGAAGLANVHTTGTGPESGTSVTPRFGQPDVRGVAEEPLSFVGIVASAQAHGPAAPKMLVTAMGTDYLSLRASLARTGAHGTADLPIPENVRIYDVAGASHSRAEESPCNRPPGQLDYFPVMRATLVNLDAWLSKDVAPPPSCLMPLEPRPGDPEILQAPAHLPTAVVQAPLRDADGNALGGIRLPDIEAPLGVHGAQNAPLTEPPCNLVGAYVAFASEALRARYVSPDDYVARIRAAAERLVADRFLLDADARVIVEAARNVIL